MVRTNFLINFVAVALLVGACFILAQRELKISNLQTSTDTLSKRIAASTPENTENLRLNQQFLTAARRIEEVQAFYRNPFIVHQFMAELAMARPQDIIFREVSFSQTVAAAPARAPRGGQAAAARPRLPTYRIDIRGDVRELEILDRFKSILEEFAFDSDGYAVAISESVQQRNQAGIFPYSIEIVLRPGS